MEKEIAFILETAKRYLSKAPTRADVLSIFAGIRPLVKASASSTAALSRDHTIHVSKTGMLTIVGGKWTTYRKMSEDCIDHAATLGTLEEKECVTRTLRIHGYDEHAETYGDLKYHGSDAIEIRKLMDADAKLAEQLHSRLPIYAAEVVWAARNEMARSVEDILARRTRALFLDANVAIAIAPRVAEILSTELNRDSKWVESQINEFNALAASYLIAK
jgi:glycerol-3-phosphate dehydrogenase